MEELYRLFTKGVSFYLCRQLGGQEIDDKITILFSLSSKPFAAADLREPERLDGDPSAPCCGARLPPISTHLVHRRRDHVSLDLDRASPTPAAIRSTRRLPREGRADDRSFARNVERDRNVRHPLLFRNKARTQISRK